MTCLAREWEKAGFYCDIDKSAKIWEPTTILKEGRKITISSKCRIGQYCFIAPRTLIMEHGAEISPLAVLGGGGDIYMGKYSSVDYGAKLIPATFTTKGLYMNDAMLAEDPTKTEVIRGSIRLEEGAVIASNAIICVSKEYPNIVIGKNSVVGAGMYLDRSVPENVVIIKRYFEATMGARF